MAFTRGRTPERSLNIGKKGIIDQWFALHVPGVNYEVDDDLNITAFGSLNLCLSSSCNSIPDNLTVHGSIIMYNQPLKKLPKNLNVHTSLYITGTDVSELPSDLRVGLTLDIRRTKIKGLPEGINAGNVWWDK